jgi:peptidoglycan/LPS O-acetylase OafA/YrhL
MKLRRITTHGNWIPEIDGLRFAAIAATLLTHIFGETYLRSNPPFASDAQHNLFGLVERGGRGVPLFFAISCFILAQPFLRQHLRHGKAVSIGAFFQRRLIRLEPPYTPAALCHWAGGLPASVRSLMEWIALTAGMCYSFYLMHMLVIAVAFKLTRRFIIPSNLLLSYLIQVVLLGACVTVFSAAYFVLIERPCMDPNWPHKLRAWLSNLSRSRKADLAETSVENTWPTSPRFFALP